MYESNHRSVHFGCQELPCRHRRYDMSLAGSCQLVRESSDLSTGGQTGYQMLATGQVQEK